jgi:phosphatidylserine decarboxylase
MARGNNRSPSRDRQGAIPLSLIPAGPAQTSDCARLKRLAPMREYDLRIVRDGIYYACALALAGVAASNFLTPWAGIPFYVLGAFCLYFFRDPERVTPRGDVLVAPADGKLVSIRQIEPGRTRASIFLNIFNVHVNRAPASGLITGIEYRPGQFRIASLEQASAQNEQNVFTLDCSGSTVVFSQIAGLIARRIVCHKRAGDKVSAGERIGLIKFGSRMDVVFGPEWELSAHPGERVKAGVSVLAVRRRKQPEVQG